MRDFIVRLASMKLAELKFKFEYFLFDADVIDEEKKRAILGKYMYYGGLFMRKGVSLNSFKENVLNMKEYFEKHDVNNNVHFRTGYSYKHKAFTLKLHLGKKSDPGARGETIGIRLYQPSGMKKKLFFTLLEVAGILDENNFRNTSPFLKKAELNFDMVVEKKSRKAWEGDKLVSTIRFENESLTKLNSVIRRLLAGSQTGLLTPMAIQKTPISVYSDKNSKKSFIRYTIQDTDSIYSPFKDSEYLVVYIRSKSLRDIKLLQTILETGFSLAKKSNSGLLEDISQFNKGPWNN